jgi:hypothetical protein
MSAVGSRAWRLKQLTYTTAFFKGRTWPCASGARPLCDSVDAEVHTLPTYEKVDVPTTLVVRKKGHDVIADPLFNKGTSFPLAERERLGLRGLLPPRILTMEQQEGRVMQDYHEGLDYVSPEEVESWSISRCVRLRSLQRLARWRDASLTPVCASPHTRVHCVHQLSSLARGLV